MGTNQILGDPTISNLAYSAFCYDSVENRLIEVDYAGMVAQYKYDPFGRRIEKNVNGDITRYFYDGADIVTEYDGNWNVKSKYTRNLIIDDPMAVEQGTNTFYYHKDGLGSVVDLTDSGGSVVKSYTYKSFGEIYSEVGSLVQPFTFTGREYDPESGLYYYRARYYDPRAGRFLTKDPIGFAGGDVNLYRYLGNSPVNHRDPFGLAATDWWDPRFYINYWGGVAGGTFDLWRNYRNMREANTIGADKYFHCMANCQASRKRLGGRDAAEFISEGRELFDQYIKGDPRSACDADREANRLGQEGDPNQSCEVVCEPLRPAGLNRRY